jgi:hypothetical protein
VILRRARQWVSGVAQWAQYAGRASDLAGDLYTPVHLKHGGARGQCCVSQNAILRLLRGCRRASGKGPRVRWDWRKDHGPKMPELSATSEGVAEKGPSAPRRRERSAPLAITGRACLPRWRAFAPTSRLPDDMHVDDVVRAPAGRRRWLTNHAKKVFTFLRNSPSARYRFFLTLLDADCHSLHQRFGRLKCDTS